MIVEYKKDYNKEKIFIFGICIFYRRIDSDEIYTRFLCFRFTKKRVIPVSQHQLVLEQKLDRILKIINPPKEKSKEKKQEQSSLPSILTPLDADNFLKKLPEKTVLLIESNNYHADSLPSVAHYFNRLGYGLDIILSYKEHKLKPFAIFEGDNVRIYTLDLNQIKKFLNNKRIDKYEFVYFNSEIVNYGKDDSVTFFSSPYLPRSKCLYMLHHPKDFKYSESVRSLMLGHFTFAGYKKPTVLVPTYFGNVTTKTKNNISRFVVVGNIHRERKNFDLLLSTCKLLINNGITNFRVTVIARAGDLPIAEELKRYIEFKGCLTYQRMYEVVSASDYILTLMDSSIPEHLRYISDGFTGSVLLSYGFRKPCLIESSFAKTYEFNKFNSIIYQNSSEFPEAIKKAISLDKQEYLKLQLELAETAMLLYDKSLQSLKNLLDEQNAK